ncbi:MAG: hypothetical protein KF773_30905 [Deltaproteobacteria bacterium]|nr:hypothetical protein [Deltaproteobacteria bacterium]
MGCGPTKDDAKGVVDDSTPPAIPFADGKADAAQKTVAVDVQSPHPYANNFDRRFDVPLSGLPSCAKDVRLHFRVLRTEASFDFVSVEPTGAPVQWFDGNHDDTWTEWFPKRSNVVKVRLDTDGSITRHGFEIDKIEWDGVPDGCPLVKFPPCADDSVDVQRRPGTCECPVIPSCKPLASVEVRYRTSRGFNVRVHHVHSNGIATEGHPGLTDGLELNDIGTVDMTRVRDLVRRAGEIGLLASNGYDKHVPPSQRRDEFQIIAGDVDVTFVAAEGAHTPEVQSLIDELEGLFACGGAGALSCDPGRSCTEQGECIVEASCFCPAIYQPVCGANGHTYSNGCAAGCADAPVVHDGECGIAGDACGTLFGLACRDGHRCRYATSTFDAPFPDAGGTCVARTYCDAPADCTALPHPAVPGSWSCSANACAWKAGLAWKPQANGAFETAHPYANSTSVWKEVYLPAEAQAMRLVVAQFQLEANYDFLEVWSYRNGAWVRAARYTGTAGPRDTEEFGGRYHYLRFVSDSSVTAPGFRLDVQWR